MTISDLASEGGWIYTVGVTGLNQHRTVGEKKAINLIAEAATVLGRVGASVRRG